MINKKQVGILLTTLCSSMISITALASCEDLLKTANDTLAQNHPLSLEQKTALKECVKGGCNQYSWALNCAHISNLVNTPTTPAQSQQSILNTKTQTINNTNKSIPPVKNDANVSSGATSTATPANQITPNGSNGSDTTPTATPTQPTKPNVNWF